MAFGAPRLSIALTNLGVVLIGVLTFLFMPGGLRFIGIGIVLVGMLLGILLNSWSKLCPVVLQRWIYKAIIGDPDEKDE